MFNEADWNIYLETYKSLLSEPSLSQTVSEITQLISSTSKNEGTVLFFGNGASASLAAHAALDFTKQAKVRSQVFHDPSYITAISNDGGYDNWIAATLKLYGKHQDCVVFISVSGESECILRGAREARSMGMRIVTLTGKGSDNSLKSLGDVNLHVPSEAYNIVEGVHSILLTGCVDSIIGASEYGVSL